MPSLIERLDALLIEVRVLGGRPETVGQVIALGLELGAIGWRDWMNLFTDWERLFWPEWRGEIRRRLGLSEGIRT